jgi:hypothetical protein
MRPCSGHAAHAATAFCGQPSNPAVRRAAPTISRRAVPTRPPRRRDDPFADRTRFGPVGQFITCAGCGLRFESRGLRYCPDCYAAMGDPVERKAGCGAERAVRRQACQGCGGDLPAYSTTGRKARQTTTFCSSACKRRASRRAGSVPDNRAPTTYPSRAPASGYKNAPGALPARRKQRLRAKVAAP